MFKNYILPYQKCEIINEKAKESSKELDNSEFTNEYSTLGFIDSIEKDYFDYSFEFEKFGKYEDTVVCIRLKIPFRKLHLLYLIPYQILKSYWSVLFRKTDNNSIKNMQECITVEKEHLSIINEFLPIEKIDLFDNFPHIIKENSEDKK